MAGYNAVVDFRERRKPVNRIKRRAGELRDEVGGRLSRTRDSMPYGVYVMRNPSNEAPDAHRSDPGMIKTLLWMGLSAGMLAVAGILARRLTASIWQAIMHEPPPTSKA